MRKISTLIISIILTSQLFAQEYEFSKAKKLSQEINSEAEEINPRITEEGNTLYYTRSFAKKNLGGKYAGQDIWYSTSENGSWDKAVNLKKLNNGDNNAVVGLNKEASKLYLINNYTSHPRRELGLVVSEKESSKKKWSRVVELPVKVEVLNDHYGFYLTPDEEVLIVSMMADETIGEEDLFVSFNKDGSWTQPQHMGTTINSTGFEISPFLSADKKKLYFSSNGFGGKGDADIFYAERLDDSWTNWTTPKNLGDNINSNAFDAYFVVSNAGKVYFSSNRGGGLSDIYSSIATVVPEDNDDKDIPIAEEEEEEKPVDVTPEKPADVMPEEPIDEKPVDEILPLPAQQIVYFDFESAALTSSAKEELMKVIRTANSRSDIKIELQGHTDVRGSEPYNDGLSERRAKAVSDYLSKNLIGKERIKIFYFGEKQIANNQNTAQAHQLNRRVEIVYKTVN